MVRADHLPAPRSSFVVAAPNRTLLSIFEIFHGIGVSAPRGGCRPVQFSSAQFSSVVFVQNPPQKTAPSRTQEPSRASVRMLEKCLSTKIFNPGGFRRKTPAVIIGGRKTEKISENPEFRRLPALAVPPLQHREHWVRQTWVIVVFPDFADLGGGIRRENRRKSFMGTWPNGAR